MNGAGKRWISWGATAVLVAAGLLWMLWPRPEPVDLTLVTRGPMVVTLDEEGETRVRERFEVSAPVAGRLLRIELEPGDPVVAGKTALAVLQPREATLLDARSRAEGEAQVEALAAELERAKHERAGAGAELEFAKRDCDRARELATRDVLSAERLELAELAKKRSSEAMDASEHAVVGASYRLASARARLLDLGHAGRKGDDPISLHAPIDGVVLRRIHESESVVAAGEPLLEVGDPTDLEIVADYLSSDAVRIHPRARVLVEQWGGDEALEGVVRRVEPSGFTKVSALGVEEKRVNVVIDLLTPPTAREGLADGFRTEVRVVVWECHDVLQASSGSLFRYRDKWAVFKVEEGRARLQPVEVGARTPASVEILGGLGEGDRIISHPGDDIADDVRVTPREEPH